MEDKLILKGAFSIIRKWLWLIISLTISAGLIAGIISFFILNPIYESSSQFLVNQNNPGANQEYTENDIRTNVELINTYKVILQSSRILDQVATELKLKMSNEVLGKKIDVSSAESSQVVTVAVTDTDPQLAVDIANTTVRIFQNEISELMNIDNVRVLSEAKLSPKPEPIGPNKLLNIFVAMLLGALTGTGIAFLWEYIDTRIKSEEDIAEKLHIPVIGVISHVDETEESKRRMTSKKKQGVMLDGTS
ncbi:capsular biosynthesis protein [Mesobacillus boroniphilus]|uniref:Capsular biosynthesis protein n=1 Tax=Mesobacillus boroniphilus TaxID=308892 RepID=A0A944CNW4_9BACI|nr:Wzz/FepE/Etk N-terminal domain-containing protein [Mesobacillus boroniphilus]MBS8266564.1 capsular biosynthesis protein [Mesobacillus boroniphilus]